MELIDKREFVKAVVDDNSETFVVYVAILKAEVSIYPLRLDQIAAL